MVSFFTLLFYYLKLWLTSLFLGGCRLKWVGNNSNAYVNNTTYEPMNNAAQGDYSPLINFLYILNNCPDWAFEEQIQTVLNVEFFLR